MYALKRLPSLKRVSFACLSAEDVADARSFAEQAAERWEVSCPAVREYTGHGLDWLEEDVEGSPFDGSVYSTSLNVESSWVWLFS